MIRHLLSATIAAVLGGPAIAQTPAPAGGVQIVSPPGAIKPTGTWNLAARAGDQLFIAGMRGIDPKTDKLVEGDEARVRQAFLNMKMIAESEGASLKDCVRIVVYVTDMFRFGRSRTRCRRNCGAGRDIRPARSSRCIA